MSANIPSVFGGFAPFPNSIATALLAYQSEAIGFGFGIKFQYGKRLIGAMTNEKFNGLDASGVGNLIEAHNSELIKRMGDEMPKWIEVQNRFIEATVKIEVAKATRTPSAFSEIFNAFAEALVTHNMSTLPAQWWGEQSSSPDALNAITAISPLMGLFSLFNRVSGGDPTQPPSEPTDPTEKHNVVFSYTFLQAQNINGVLSILTRSIDIAQQLTCTELQSIINGLQATEQNNIQHKDASAPWTETTIIGFTRYWNAKNARIEYMREQADFCG